MKVHWKVDSRELTVGKDPSEINETSNHLNLLSFQLPCMLQYLS